MGVAAASMVATMGACAKDSGTHNNDTSTTTTAKPAEDKKKEATETPEGEKASEKDAKAVNTVVSTFYTNLFVKKIGDNSPETLQKAQEGITKALGEEHAKVLDSGNPREDLAKLPNNVQERVLRETEQYSKDLVDVTTYNKLNTAEKITFNIVVLMFRGSIAGQLDGKELTISVNKDEVFVDGDNANVSGKGIVFTAKEKSSEPKKENNIVQMNTPLTKDGKWKIDAGKFMDNLFAMSPNVNNSTPAEGTGAMNPDDPLAGLSKEERDKIEKNPEFKKQLEEYKKSDQYKKDKEAWSKMQNETK